MNELINSVFSWFILILGLSYLFQCENWIRLAGIFEDQTFRFYPLSLLILVMGLVIVHAHNFWEFKWQLAITLLGWILVIKNAVYLLCTSCIDQFMLTTRTMRLWLRVTGTIFSFVGAILVFQSILSR